MIQSDQFHCREHGRTRFSAWLAAAILRYRPRETQTRLHFVQNLVSGKDPSPIPDHSNSVFIRCAIANTSCFQVYPKKNPEASTKIVVWKRFNEFKILYRDLKRRHEELRIGGDFPKFVKSSFFHRDVLCMSAWIQTTLIWTLKSCQPRAELHALLSH